MQKHNILILTIFFLLLLCLFMASHAEYFHSQPGFVFKIIVERELNRWKLLPKSGNVQNSCLKKITSQQVQPKSRTLHPYEFLKWARQNQYDVVIIPYKPQTYCKDSYIYQDEYSDVYVGKRNQCMNEMFDYQSEHTYVHNNTYVLDPEKN